MFAVVTADVHVHPHKDFNEVDAEGNSWRVTRSIDALRQVFDTAKRNQCPVFLAGDLLHDKRGVPTEVIGPLKQLLSDHADIQVRFLVGNHERPDHFSRANTLAWLDNGTTHRVITAPTLECFNHLGFEVAVCFLPWSETLHADLAVMDQTMRAFAERYPHTPRVLIGHACIDGAEAENGTKLRGEVKVEELNLPAYNLGLFGDIHKAQRIADNAWYCGALLQQRSSESANLQTYMAIQDNLTATPYPIEGIPTFARSDSVEKIGKVVDEDTGETFLMKPSAEAVAVALQERVPDIRMAMDLTDLKSMVAQYMDAMPSEDGFTFEHIWSVVEQEMNRAN